MVAFAFGVVSEVGGSKVGSALEDFRVSRKEVDVQIRGVAAARRR